MNEWIHPLFFLGLEFFETSAKENINVKAVFEKLVEIICNKMAESLDKVRKGEGREGREERGGTGGSMPNISARSQSGSKRNEIGCEYDSEASISTVQLLIALISLPHVSTSILPFIVI